MAEPVEWKTSDLYLAAFFHACNEPVVLERTERAPGGGTRIFFVFKGEQAVFDRLRMAFINRTEDSQVLAPTYADSVKHFKQLCFPDTMGSG